MLTFGVIVLLKINLQHLSSLISDFCEAVSKILQFGLEKERMKEYFETTYLEENKDLRTRASYVETLQY